MSNPSLSSLHLDLSMENFGKSRTSVPLSTRVSAPGATRTAGGPPINRPTEPSCLGCPIHTRTLRMGGVRLFGAIPYNPPPTPRAHSRRSHRPRWTANANPTTTQSPHQDLEGARLQPCHKPTGLRPYRSAEGRSEAAGATTELPSSTHRHQSNLGAKPVKPLRPPKTTKTPINTGD